MNRADYIAQPASRTTLDAFRAILQEGSVESIDVAVAYVTSGGAYDLLKKASDTLGGAWAAIPKRWITSFDYCRTEPVALESLLSVPNSTVRIHDAAFCLEHGGAPRVSAALLTSYDQVVSRTDNLKTPAPTEDDIASSETAVGALSTKDLQKLRVCRNLWIEAGNITKNRGPTLPGNQLMMKRLSRVFFGFRPTPVPENTAIGTVQIGFGGAQPAPFSLTYSDNKMDKLVLPIPGNGGPAAYDNEYLLFQRVKPGVFQLQLGNKAMKAQWLKRSKAIEGAFKMSSGREWGVF